MRRFAAIAGLVLLCRVAALAVLTAPEFTPARKVVRAFRQGDVVAVDPGEHTLTIRTGLGSRAREIRVTVVDGFSKVFHAGMVFSFEQIRRGDYVVVRYDVPHATGRAGEAPLVREVRVSRSRGAEPLEERRR